MTLANNLTMAGAYFSLQEYGTFTQGDTIEYKQLKLERGSIATPWSYAQDDITTISNTTNEVKQTADKNSSRISNLTTTLGSTVRNLLVGGVSPRGGGQRPTSDILEAIAPNTWYTYDTIATPVASLARTNDHSIKYQRTSDTSTNSGIVIPLVEPNIIAIGETLTLSFWYKGSKTSLGDCYLLYTAGNNQKQGGNWNGLVTDDQEWHRYEKTFTATSTNTTGDMYALLIAYNRVANDWLEIKDGTMMLERGDVATRMSLAETTIDQTANNILIKATETDTTAAQGGQHIIQSLINVAPEGVKISAQKIQIDGSAIFTAISDSVDTAITNKGYQTATEVESAIGDVKDMMTFFATCNTAAGTAIKDATIIDGQSGFTLKQGASVDVKFTNTNTVAVGNLKLRVNSSNENDAKSIKTMRNSSLTNLANAGVLAAGGTIHFVYDGTY